MFGNPPATELNSKANNDVTNQKKLRPLSHQKTADLMKNSKLFPPILRNMPDETEFVILLPDNTPDGTKKGILLDKTLSYYTRNGTYYRIILHDI